VNAQTKQAKKVGVSDAAGPMAGDMTNEATPRHERAEQVEGAVARSHALAPIVSNEMVTQSDQVVSEAVVKSEAMPGAGRLVSARAPDMKPRSRPSRKRGRTDTREEVGNSPPAAPIRPCETFKPEQIPLEQPLEAQWNANRVPPRLLAKVRRSIVEFGVIENPVARPHPELPEKFEVLSGNHRLRVLRELGHETAPVVVVELGDAEARLLAQTLNRTRGTDNPAAYARLLEEVLARFAPARVAEFLPERRLPARFSCNSHGSCPLRTPSLRCLEAPRRASNLSQNLSPMTAALPGCNAHPGFLGSGTRVCLAAGVAWKTRFAGRSLSRGRGRRSNAVASHRPRHL
jgi:hypothetical protein